MREIEDTALPCLFAYDLTLVKDTTMVMGGDDYYRATDEEKEAARQYRIGDAENTLKARRKQISETRFKIVCFNSTEIKFILGYVGAIAIVASLFLYVFPYTSWGK